MALRVNAILTADGAQFYRTMNRAELALGSVARRMAAVFSVGAIAAFTKQAAQWAANLTDMAAKTGLTVEQLQRLELAANKAGVEMGSLVKAYQMLEVKRFGALRGDANALASFAGFGINQNDLQTKSTKELFDSLTRFIAETPNAERLIGPLRDVFGRQGPELIEAFASYSADAMHNIATVSSYTAEELDELFDAMGEFRQQVKALTAELLGKTFSLAKQGAAVGMGLYRYLRHGEDPNAVYDFLMGLDSADREKRAAARRNRRVLPELDDFIGPKTGANSIARTKLYTDPLLSVGNFLGAGSGLSSRIMERQLAEARKTNELLRQVNDAIRPAINAVFGGFNA